MGRFLCGDCLDIMNTIDSGSIDFIMTSPPYADQIKDYGEKVKKIDPNNIRRVARALEIYKVTGKTKTQLDIESRKEVKYDYRLFGMEWDRETLYNRIDLRVDKMIEAGLIDEVRNVTEKFKISNTAVQGLGYKEVIEFLNGNISYEEMIEKLKLETRHYAKRQLTFFRHQFKDVTRFEDLDEAFLYAKSRY